MAPEERSRLRTIVAAAHVSSISFDAAASRPSDAVFPSIFSALLVSLAWNRYRSGTLKT
jgi:hypothetical protein